MRHWRRREGGGPAGMQVACFYSFNVHFTLLFFFLFDLNSQLPRLEKGQKKKNWQELRNHFRDWCERAGC